MSVDYVPTTALHWTRDGELRRPRYQDLREDRLAGEVIREVAS